VLGRRNARHRGQHAFPLDRREGAKGGLDDPRSLTTVHRRITIGTAGADLLDVVLQSGGARGGSGQGAGGDPRPRERGEAGP
jgi:hypothetical protein